MNQNAACLTDAIGSWWTNFICHENVEVRGQWIKQQHACYCHVLLGKTVLAPALNIVRIVWAGSGAGLTSVKRYARYHKL